MEYITECIFKTYDEEERTKAINELIKEIILKQAEKDE